MDCSTEFAVSLIKSPCVGNEHRDTVIEPDTGGHWSPGTVMERLRSVSFPLRQRQLTYVGIYHRCERPFKSGSMDITRKRAYTAIRPVVKGDDIKILYKKQKLF